MNEIESSLTAVEEQMLDLVADHATQSETLSWERKHRNLLKFIDQLEPIEDELLRLVSEKQSLLACIDSTRNTMVENCIHPKDLLVLHDGHVVCKFCDRKFVVKEEKNV